MVFQPHPTVLLVLEKSETIIPGNRKSEGWNEEHVLKRGKGPASQMLGEGRAQGEQAPLPAPLPPPESAHLRQPGAMRLLAVPARSGGGRAGCPVVFLPL